LREKHPHKKGPLFCSHIWEHSLKAVNNNITSTIPSSCKAIVPTPTQSYDMAVATGTAFSLHQLLLAKLAATQPPVKTHPDTTATGHFLPVGCKGKPLPNEEIEAICANGASMQSVGTQELDIPLLPAKAKKAHTFIEMDKALLSVPELVDADCNVNFNQKGVVVIDNNTEQVILKGRRDPATRLWLIPIVQQPIKIEHQFKFKIPTSDVPHTVNSAYTNNEQYQN
jgi:hypothetical protein